VSGRADRETERLRGYVEDELRASATYRALAAQVQGEPAAVLSRLADGEERHARHWQRVLATLDPEPDGAPYAPSSRGPRVRFLAWLVRRGGLLPVLAVLERRESAEIDRYGLEPHAPPELVEEERTHAQLLNAVSPDWRARAAGTLRAGVFGMSDGVVSNLALVMGVLGADATPRAVVVAGVAGLLAGALSMGVGEYVSVASQREILAGGVEEVPAGEEIGSPLRAASASLAAFALGAALPLLPFLVSSGAAAAATAVVLAGLALYTLGASISLLTGLRSWRSGGRQLLLGLAAAATTFLIGQLLGVALSP
jgi:VIT1/CCC1 family predicted Fe2+/Mn2+ transporter